MIGQFFSCELRQRTVWLCPCTILGLCRDGAALLTGHAARHQPIQLEQHARTVRHRLASCALRAAEFVIGKSVLLCLRQYAFIVFYLCHVLSQPLRIVEQLGKARNIIAIKCIGIQIAANHNRHIRRKRTLDFLINRIHLCSSARTVRAVFQMDNHSADFTAADIQRTNQCRRARQCASVYQNTNCTVPADARPLPSESASGKTVHCHEIPFRHSD